MSEAWHVGRTMRVLELLSITPMSAPQVAAELHAQPRTARRVLTRLVAEGYLTTREDGRRRLYEPTMRLVALGGQTVEHSRLGRVGRPSVERLAERTGLAAHLIVPGSTSALCVAHADGPGGQRASGLRELLPAYATAGGKVLLAARPDWRARVLAEPLERFTPQTITDRRTLTRELDRIEARGFGTEAGEHRDGVHGVAVPVVVDGEAVAALSCSGTAAVADASASVLERVAGRLVRELAAR